MPWGFVIDPTSEDATNVQLNLNDGTTYRVYEPVSLEPPPLDPRRAESVETEGALPVLNRHHNREIRVNVHTTGATASALGTTVATLQRKVAKLNREGGTLKVTTPGGVDVVFDVVAAEAKPVFDHIHALRHYTVTEIMFEARPYGRGTATLLADHTETTLPALVFAEQDIAGDVPALGRLVVDEDDADDQWFVQWGVESRYYDTTNPTNKRLFIEAEAMNALSGSTKPAVATASGGTVVRNTDLTTSPQGVVSTTLGTSYLAHVGSYRVFARLYRPTTNAGTVEVAFEWAEGDFRKFTPNEAVTFDVNEREGMFTHTDLGIVNLDKVAQGTQRWEGRVVAKSTTVGDELDVDCLYFFPIDAGYGEVRGAANLPTPTAFAARDEFQQTAGSLTGKALPTGGTWTVVSGSSANDFTINTTDDVAERSATLDSDGLTGRLVSAGTTNYAGVVVKVDLGATGSTGVGFAQFGVFARLTDIGNYLAAVSWDVDGERSLLLFKVITSGQSQLDLVATGVKATDDASLSLQVLATGTYIAAMRDQYGREVGRLEGWDEHLATGATLATGRVGLFDVKTDSSAATRSYDNFTVAQIAADAAMFASQSLELRHDRVIREDSAGTIWTPVSDYEGTYLTIPPAGNEDRQARLIVKASRNLPETGADSGIDNISARLTVTPRYLQLPG